MRLPKTAGEVGSDIAMSDPAAEELLMPAGVSPPPAQAASTAGAAATVPAATAAPLSFQQALQAGIIPTFEPQPADLASDPYAPPVDPAEERAAWLELMETIRQFKDPGTTVTIVDAETFMKGLD